MAPSIEAISQTTRRIAIKDIMSLHSANTLEDSRTTLFQGKERKKGRITPSKEPLTMEKE